MSKIGALSIIYEEVAEFVKRVNDNEITLLKVRYHLTGYEEVSKVEYSAACVALAEILVAVADEIEHESVIHHQIEPVIPSIIISSLGENHPDLHSQVELIRETADILRDNEPNLRYNHFQVISRWIVVFKQESTLIFRLMHPLR